MADAASSRFLPRIVGIAQALEWCYTGRVFTAQEVLAARQLSNMVPPDQLLATARVIGHEIAEKTPPGSIALNRQMMWRMLAPMILWKPHKTDSRVSYTLGRSAYAREGMIAFLEKRPPVLKSKVSADMPDYFLVDEREYK